MKRLLAASLAALLPLAAAAPAQRPITKTEIRTAPPGETHRRLRDQFWQMIEGEDLRRDRPPRHRLSDVWVGTEPRGTEIPGLCRYDTLRIEFHPLRRDASDADSPVVATGFTSTSWLRFLSPPAGPARQIADYRRLPSDEPGCAGLGDEAFFAAEDAELAADGWFALLELQRALRGNRELPLECVLHRTDPADGCREVILALGHDDLNEVRRCDSRPDGSWCTRISADDRRIDIYTSSALAGGRPFGEVLGARLESLIVLWHERAD